jgi:hypothetical protein
MTPQTSLRKALTDPQLLGSVLGGESWAGWRALLLGAMGEKLKPGELETFRKLTNREPPGKRVDELIAVIGRRGGKSSAIAGLAVYLSALCKHKLVRGERGVVLCIAPDQRQSRVLLDYACGILEGSPLFTSMISRRTADTVELSNGHSIEVRSAQFRRLRGLTCIGAIADEACFWRSEDSTNPDKEILDAVRPALATTGGPLIIISSPYSRKGVVWEAFRKHFGPDGGDPEILVARGMTTDLNPTIDPKIIARALERDEAAARAEYLAEFRSDLEGYVDLDVIKACVAEGVRERAPENRNSYVAFTDPSGGSGDSFTLCVAHKEGKVCVVDALREVKAPFSPEAAVAELSATLRGYRCSTVYGDKYAGEWPAEAFRKHGVYYEPAEKSKSELYVDLLPALNSRTIDLLDHDRLVQQICGLERRVSRAGKDSIDHGPGGRDDLANVLAGVVAMVDRRSSGDFWKPLEYPQRSMW